jgi:hypothetical protein
VNTALLRPGNVLIIAGISLAAMFLMSAAKLSLSGSKAGGVSPVNPAPTTGNS